MLNGKMTMALTQRNADPAQGFNIQDSDSRYFLLHTGSPGDLLCESIKAGF